MATRSVSDCDVAVLGGGIAGLWTLDRLRAAGYRAVLLEKNALGEGQTIAAQGIIHSGVKYHVSKDLVLDALTGMPARWRTALANREGPDLSAAHTLSSAVHLWVPPRLGADLVARAARELSRSDTSVVAREDWPTPFRGQRSGGALSQVAETVLDVPSVLAALAAGHRDVVRRLPESRLDLQDATLHCGPLILKPRCIVIAAGAGNEHLPEALGLAEVACQRRPLHQVIVAGMRQPVYAHCLGTSVKPLATITSHPDGGGGWFWYVGGGIAERGVGIDAPTLLQSAREKLQAWFPGADFDRSRWATFAIDRAEFGGDPGSRPGDVHIEQRGNAFVAWPTKLALAPRLADLLVDRVAGLIGGTSRHAMPLPPEFEALDIPGIAVPPWRRIEQWS